MEWDKLLSDERAGRSTSKTVPGRSAFDLDYERALFSTPVRRLQDKAQVFPLEPNDSVRTRLTHSLEVSTVARSLARQAFHAISRDDRFAQHLKPRPDQLRDIETIAATAGLIHDLGNPPFGHSGENAIADWFRKRKKKLGLFDAEMQDRPQLTEDFLRFEGNAQTLRLVTCLQVLADYHGLNLTFGTLSACFKYLAASHKADRKSPYHEMTKPGFFASEEPLVRAIQDATGTGNARNPITFLVEAADDLVYSACDLEDAVRKGVLSWLDFEESLRERTRASTFDSELIESVLTSVKKLIEAKQVHLDSTERPKTEDGIRATAFRICLHGRAIPAVIKAFATRYPEIMAGEYHSALVHEGDAHSLIGACKTVGALDVYGAGNNPELELMGRRVIHDLMELFWEGAETATESTKTKEFPEKIVSRISRNYKDLMLHNLNDPKRTLPERYLRLQLVTDFVCGMTDSFARDLHRKLFNG